MSDRSQPEHETLEDLGEGEGEPVTDAEGGGGAWREEGFTTGGPRGRDAERGEYYEPDERDED
jgi:hypothetical protein